ncbi:hypothetical protein CEXT_620481 [Caerostris extrusa]|uniref:Uncharacterized protein n=1 Tax=Caerostris extrusa TaxID=172846 RepID=A0AAV4M5P6_CAEEX|nr:hypothetical protein CEXT_620481 [Caerostris extrusa]
MCSRCYANASHCPTGIHLNAYQPRTIFAWHFVLHAIKEKQLIIGFVFIGYSHPQRVWRKANSLWLLFRTWMPNFHCSQYQDQRSSSLTCYVHPRHFFFLSVCFSSAAHEKQNRGRNQRRRNHRDTPFCWSCE